MDTEQTPEPQRTPADEPPDAPAPAEGAPGEVAPEAAPSEPMPSDVEFAGTLETVPEPVPGEIAPASCDRPESEPAEAVSSAPQPPEAVSVEPAPVPTPPAESETISGVSVESMQKLTEQALAEIQTAPDAPAIEALRVKYAGRKGLLREAFTRLGQAAPEQRPALGQAINAARQAIEQALAAKTFTAPVVEKPSFDFSLPGKRLPRGRLHPLNETIDAIKDIFARLGFEVAVGPEVELDYCNFEALNIPADHPSRDGFDTFLLHDDVLLRSQTSTVQVRVMESRKPPIRVIAPGKVFRPDTVDATHGFLFHQLEGLVVDEGVTMADLKYVLHEFARGLYGPDIKMRFRPSFFPFTEPSVEVDISCFVCGGKGCSVCKKAGWIEILGAGMVDPNVFRAVGIDPERYTGFAFGMGVERVAMRRYGINDMRLFLENDLRFLRQF